MEKSQSSVAHFRTRILHAIEQMQSSLGLINLGQLFYKPLRDSEGTVVFCTIRTANDAKMIGQLSLRWLPLRKLLKRASVVATSTNNTSSSLSSSNYYNSERVSDSGIGSDSGGSGVGASNTPRLIGDILLSTLPVWLNPLLIYSFLSLFILLNFRK